MAGKNGKKSTNKLITEAQLGVIMENVEHKFDLILESHEAVKADLKREFREEIGKVRFDMDVKFAQVDARFEQMEENFRFLSAHLLRIEDDIEEIKQMLGKKADKKDFNLLFVRVGKLEKELAVLKKRIKQGAGR
jgi:hypothetical protein